MVGTAMVWVARICSACLTNHVLTKPGSRDSAKKYVNRHIDVTSLTASEEGSSAGLARCLDPIHAKTVAF